MKLQEVRIKMGGGLGGQDSPVVPLAPEALTEAEQRASLLADAAGQEICTHVGELSSLIAIGLDL